MSYEQDRIRALEDLVCKQSMELTALRKELAADTAPLRHLDLRPGRVRREEADLWREQERVERGRP